MKRRLIDFVPLSRVRMKTNDDGRIEENSDISTNGDLTPEFEHTVRLFMDQETVATLDNRNVSATLGRSSRCDIRVHNPTVSSLHCCLVMKSNGLYIVDMKSTNGTFVKSSGGSRRIFQDHVLLCHGDIICVDTTEYKVAYL